MKKTIYKKILIALLTVLLVCICFSVHAEDLKLTLEVPETTLAAGTTIKVIPSLSDETIKKAKYVWETSDKKVATVSNGSVRAVGEGKATITCSTTIDDKTIQEAFTVNVYVPVKSVSIKQKNLTLEVGNSKRIEVSITPENATNKKMTWKSDNPSVATVNENGSIKAVYGGTCTVTGTTEDGSNKSVSVSVFVPSMSCRTDEVNLVIGKVSTITVELYTKNKNAIIVDDKNASNNINDKKIDGNNLIIKAIPWLAGQSTLTVTDPNSPKSTIKVKLITTPENGIKKGYINIYNNDNEYKKCLRGSVNGKYVQCFGYVRQIEYSGNRVVMLIATKNKYDNYVYTEFEIPSGSKLPRIIEGDQVNILGKADNVFSYKTVMGSTNTVPKVETMGIGIDSENYFMHTISGFYFDCFGAT